MMRRVFLGVLGALGSATMLAGCDLFGKSNSYRFRMTVEVQTPQGLKLGSSVYRVWAAANNAKLLPEEHARDWGVKGEAAVIDLGGGQLLFALLKTVNPMREDLAQMSMGALDPTFHNDIVESAGRIATGDGTRAHSDVARADWPMVVRFRDINDPKSVEKVDPGVIGVKRIWVETTNDPVTVGIGKRLPWLGERGNVVSGPTMNPTFDETLYHESF